MSNVESAVPVTYEALRAEVAAAIRPFGFQGREVTGGAIRVWRARKDNSSVEDALRQLDGWQSDIRVTVLDGGLSIQISDLDGRGNTPFMQELRRAIEMRVTERFGISGIEFKRHIILH